MPLLGNVDKQPGEEIGVTIDLAKHFTRTYGGGSVQTVVVTMPGNPGAMGDLVLGPGVLNDYVPLPGNQGVRIYVGAGLTGRRYRVQAAIKHSSGETEEWEFDVNVRELSP